MTTSIDIAAACEDALAGGPGIDVLPACVAEVTRCEDVDRASQGACR